MIHAIFDYYDIAAKWSFSQYKQRGQIVEKVGKNVGMGEEQRGARHDVCRSVDSAQLSGGELPTAVRVLALGMRISFNFVNV